MQKQSMFSWPANCSQFELKAASICRAVVVMCWARAHVELLQHLHTLHLVEVLWQAGCQAAICARNLHSRGTAVLLQSMCISCTANHQCLLRDCCIHVLQAWSGARMSFSGAYMLMHFADMPLTDHAHIHEDQGHLQCEDAVCCHRSHACISPGCSWCAGCQAYLGSWVQGLPRCQMTEQDYVNGHWEKLSAECAPTTLQVGPTP